MPKRSSKKRLEEITSEQANGGQEAMLAPAEPPAEQEQHAPPSPGKNPAAVELGRRGGLKGGKARAAKLTKEQRAEIAKKAAAARWGKKN